MSCIATIRFGARLSAAHQAPSGQPLTCAPNPVLMLPHTAGTSLCHAHLQVQRCRSNPGWMTQQDNTSANLSYRGPSITPQCCSRSALPSRTNPLYSPSANTHLFTPNRAQAQAQHRALLAQPTLRLPHWFSPLRQLLLARHGTWADAGGPCRALEGVLSAPTPMLPITGGNPGHAADMQPRSMRPRRWLSHARPACRRWPRPPHRFRPLASFCL